MSIYFCNILQRVQSTVPPHQTTGLLADISIRPTAATVDWESRLWCRKTRHLRLLIYCNTVRNWLFDRGSMNFIRNLCLHILPQSRIFKVILRLHLNFKCYLNFKCLVHTCIGYTMGHGRI